MGLTCSTKDRVQCLRTKWFDALAMGFGGIKGGALAGERLLGQPGESTRRGFYPFYFNAIAAVSSWARNFLTIVAVEGHSALRSPQSGSHSKSGKPMIAGSVILFFLGACRLRSLLGLA
jgi:hypothetical protein